MRVLITGVSGLLGINLALEMAEEHMVFGVVNNHPLCTAALPAGKSLNIIRGDLTQPGVLHHILKTACPEWIIHCAALANLDACEADPALAHRLNSEVPGELAAIAVEIGARLVHISTDAVFDGQKGDYSEEDAPNPLSVYARSKLDGERRVLDADPEAVVARVNMAGAFLESVAWLSSFSIIYRLAGMFWDLQMCIFVLCWQTILLVFFRQCWRKG
jgi:dTDP-4-dehydrorhamnose reductase